MFTFVPSIQLGSAKFIISTTCLSSTFTTNNTTCQRPDLSQQQRLERQNYEYPYQHETYFPLFHDHIERQRQRQRKRGRQQEQSTVMILDRFFRRGRDDNTIGNDNVNVDGINNNGNGNVDDMKKNEIEEPIDITTRAKLYPAIRIENLHKTFKRRVAGKGSNNRKKKESQMITAVDDLSLTVQAGTIFGLLGPNSCGKSTTMRCMSTLTEPDSGRIEYFGIDALKHDQLARNMFGLVMQSNGLDKTLTGREHLEFFAGLAHVDIQIRHHIINELIDLLQLDPFIDRLAAVYSGGVIRRLDLAIALLHRPPILILDEPTVGLDIESRRVIWDTLQHWKKQGGTVFFSSHYLEEVDMLSDTVAIMDRGIIIAQGTPTDLKNGLGGDRISVRLDEFTSAHQAEYAAQELRKKNLVLEAIVNSTRSNTLELVVDPNDATIGTLIVQALQRIGHDRLFSFSQSKPSLDDVYLAATGQSISDADNIAKSTRTEKAIRQENMT